MTKEGKQSGFETMKANRKQTKAKQFIKVCEMLRQIVIVKDFYRITKLQNLPNVN